jgi:hypothetical protein
MKSDQREAANAGQGLFADRYEMNKFRHLTVLILLTLFAAPAAGQNDYSLRLRSLGVDLAGLVTDPYSDAYLNPARLAVFENKEIYAAKHPGRTLYADFPVFSSYYFHNGIQESSTISTSSNPLVFNVLLPAGRSLVLSFGAQLDINGDDDIDSNSLYEIPGGYNNDLIFWGSNSTERTTDEKHLVFDAAAVRPGDTSLGIRLTARYDLDNFGYFRVINENRMDFATQSELSTYQDNDVENPNLEVSSLMMSAGLYRPDHLITDFKLGAGLIRQQIKSAAGSFYLNDDDVDGNGLGVYGRPDDDYLYELDRYDSNRDYLAYKVFSRIHLHPTGKLKSVFSAAYEWSEGDGGAQYNSVHHNYRSNGKIITRKQINYDYEGSTQEVNLHTSIGYSDEIHDGILIAAGLRGLFIWSRFEEDGPGQASFYQKDIDFPNDSVSVSSDYFQRHDLKKTSYGLVFPVACEWKVQKYVTFRLGTRFGASWTDDDKEYQRSISDFVFPGGEQNTLEDMDCRTWYSTYFNVSNGLEVNINDRFIVELSSGSSYAIDLAYYSYFSLRYRF